MPRQFVADFGTLFERERPDLVICEFGNPGGALEAKLAEIPVTGHAFGRMSQGDIGTAIRQVIHSYIAEIGDAGAMPLVDRAETQLDWTVGRQPGLEELDIVRRAAVLPVISRASAPAFGTRQHSREADPEIAVRGGGHGVTGRSVARAA